MTDQYVKAAIIGGSGLYRMRDIRDVQEVRIDTPFGAPSDAVILGTLSGVRCAFLPRHGRHHTLLPSEINGRANIWALKSLGAEILLAFSAVGSLKPNLAPGDFVFADQLVDETRGRCTTFFGDGLVAHVAFAEPFCPKALGLLHQAARKLGIRSHRGGTLCCMEGPAFSSKAESAVHRKHGYSLIGMTGVPEAKLAREAEICYAPVCMVTDYDCWKKGDEVSAEKVVAVLSANSENAQRLVAAVLPELQKLPSRTCACSKALDNAIMTRPEAMSKDTLEKLALLIGRHVRR
ncbi:MAG: S-methyl-5'-thioadenosine phosphorylase [Elusimicrobia bacterium]|nr:S-methyl-5'-thioadenosine phosphorylase [Elusimicrobiota bacterium]